MKFSAKQMTTAVISTLIMLMLFAIFVLFYNSQQNDITYIIDEANTCTWQQGVIVSSTGTSGQGLKTTSVDEQAEAAYLQDAAGQNICTVREGDMAGAYAAGINQAYQEQR